MKVERKWTDKMLMAALIIGVAGAAARSATPQKNPSHKPETKTPKERPEFKGVIDRRLALLMFEFEQEIKAELQAKSKSKKSEPGASSPLPPREEFPAK